MYACGASGALSQGGGEGQHCTVDEFIYLEYLFEPCLTTNFFLFSRCTELIFIDKLSSAISAAF